MSTLDIFLIIALAAAFGLGLRSGLLQRAARLAAFVAAVIGARLFAPLVLGWMDPDDTDSVLLDTLLAYAGTFIVVYVPVLLGAGVVARGIGWAIPDVVDRFLGAVFNMLEWLMVISLALDLLVVVSPNALVQKGREPSRFTYFAVDFAPALLGGDNPFEILKKKAVDAAEDAVRNVKTEDLIDAAVKVYELRDTTSAAQPQPTVPGGRLPRVTNLKNLHP